jgi:hypothetical protein
MAKFGYMKDQNDINEKMRAILVDWLVEVHSKYSMRTDTLFITVSLIDRYLEKKQVHRTRLQLVGVASLFIASKYEEIYPPEVKDFMLITDRAFSVEEILDMEGDILSTLDFNIVNTTANRFLERFSNIL